MHLPLQIPVNAQSLWSAQLHGMI